MAKFCGKCGTNLDAELGLCPNCDQAEIERIRSIPNFCIICGGQMDKQTGLCPNCSNESDDEQLQPDAYTVCGSEVAKQAGVCPDYYNNDDAVELDRADEPVENTAPRKRNTVVDGMITLLLSVCVFLMAFVALTIFCVRQSSTEQGLEKILNNVQGSAFLNETVRVYSPEQNDWIGSYDYFCSYLKEKANVTVTEQQIDSFVEKSTVKKFLVEKISMYADDLYGDSVEFSLTAQEVLTLLKENAEIINSEFGTSIPEKTLAEIANLLVDEEVIKQMGVTELKHSMPESYYALRIGLSYFTMGTLLFFCAFCIFIMFNNNFSQAVFGVGIVFVALGAAMGVPAGVAIWSPSTWEMAFGGSTIGLLLGEMLSVNIGLFGVLFAIGFFILLGRKIIGSFMKKYKQQSTVA